ncbi:hypothetical protein CONLIGDRAFT_277018 [Coniochaeta ligniaria NRRL 30616]|uniref:Fungal N-terminal domain-containing protein n=1 Tax=Coniochaeta ligniaria NRRL 30616 TaxID=1408157 RepID=A0A1J7JRX6_9PEZI|nr:hypothetical protein CONLIGDRAFT_277018 [Coniochaeta ligniaria NRRL 30616]
MADPISILGAAAAGSQIVELAATSLLKTIRFVKDLHDVPKRMAVVFQDVEKSTNHVHYIFSVMLQPGSKVFEQLDTAQFATLTQTASELRQAMDEVSMTLKPLLGPGDAENGKTARRFWRSVMCVKLEKSLKEKMHRIDWLGNEVSRQLGITTLELQAAADQKLDNISMIAQGDHTKLLDTLTTHDQNLRVALLNQHTTTTTHLKSIASTTRDAQRVMTETQGRLTSIGADLSRVAEDAAFIRRELATSDRGQELDRLPYQHMEDLLYRLAAETREPILRLRDELLSLLVGDIPELSATSQRTCSRIDGVDGTAVQQYARIQLMRYPASMAKASSGARYTPESTKRRCRCRTSYSVSDTTIWRLTFRTECRTDHRRDCPYAKDGYRFRAFSTKVALTPFLKGTLQCVIGATTGPGFWSMAPPLRYHGNVQRITSPLFQAFDQSPALCAKTVVPVRALGVDDVRRRGRMWFAVDGLLQNIPAFELRDIGYWEQFVIEWDTPSTELQLRSLVSRIRTELSHGRASGMEMDEQGHTILFDFVQLMLLLRGEWAKFESQLADLLDTVLSSGVDIAARSDTLGIGDPWYSSPGKPSTAWDFIFRDLRNSDMGSNYLESASFAFSRLFLHPSAHSDLMLSIPDACGNTLHSDQHLKRLLVQRHPEIAEGMDFDDFEMAVLRKSLPGVEHLVALELKKAQLLDRRHRPFDLTELALGWDIGLRYLVLAKYPVRRAVESACALQDHQSLSILLETPRDIFSAELFYSSSAALNSAVRWEDQRAFDTVVEELRRRRAWLKAMALRHVPRSRHKELGLNEEIMLDVTAEATYSHLKQVIAVPEALECWISPYYLARTHICLSTYFLEALYEGGFKAIDIPDNDDNTPLFQILTREILQPDFEWLPWFLSRGAKPERELRDPDDFRWPTMLFYLALAVRRRWMFTSIAPLLRACKKASVYVEAELHSVTDGCVCLCGSDGCLATHFIWRCNAHGCWCSFKFTADIVQYHPPLEKWVTAWNLSDESRELIYRELTRLELFERLGMAHTCCCRGRNSGRFEELVRERLDDDESSRLRDEDGELAMQLDDLLAQYNNARNAYGGSIESFWRKWWQVLDEILPPLLPIEACNTRLTGHQDPNSEEARELDRATAENRSAREEEALKRAGYVGPDFQDFRHVIRVHFSGRDWSPAHEDSGNEAWETCSSDTDSCASESAVEDWLDIAIRTGEHLHPPIMNTSTD